MNIVISIDLGLQGGISIFKTITSTTPTTPKIFKMPVCKTVVNRKQKTVLDIPAIVCILQPYQNDHNFIVCETVHAMPRQGGVSNFTFGYGAGVIAGIAYALGFDYHTVSPQSWKKHYPEVFKNQELNNMRATLKILKDKNKQNFSAKIKKLAKTKTINYVNQKYPNLSVKSDGIADSIMIGIYAIKNNV
jgi:hypothetical protein